MSSLDLFVVKQQRRRSWVQKLFKPISKNKKQKHHQKASTTTTQKRFRIMKHLEMAISDKNPQKVEELLFRFFDVLLPEDMSDLIIKSIIADEPECTSQTCSYSSDNFSRTLLHTIMKCMKHQTIYSLDLVPIHMAVKLKRVGAVSYLLERQPTDVNLPTRSDLRPPLHLAAFGGSEVMVKLLIDNGADMNSRDIYGNTALHVAVQVDADPIVELLLSEIAKTLNPCFYVNFTNNDGWTPLHLSAYRGKISTCKILLESGAYVDCQTKSGKTPLHWASIKSNKETVSILMEHAADLEATDRNERMPFQYATIKAIKNIIDVSESRRSSKSGSLRKVSIRIDPRSRNYWQVSKTHEFEKSTHSDTTTMNSPEKHPVCGTSPKSDILINSYISSIDVLQLPHGIKPNLSEPDLSHQTHVSTNSNSLHVPVSLTNSISSFRSLGNSSKISEFYNHPGKKHLFSHDESGIFEQSIRDDESCYNANKILTNDCQITLYKNLLSVSYDELLALYKQINSLSGWKHLISNINPNFYTKNPLLELYTGEAITCIKNSSAAWISICQKFTGENEEVMFFVGKMTAVFQDEHKDRCLCQRCVEQLMLLISLYLFQGRHFQNDQPRVTPIKKTSNLMASLFAGFSKRAAYEKFSEKFSYLCAFKRKGITTPGLLLESIEENKNKLNIAIVNMAQHIKSFVPPDVCPKNHLVSTSSECYEQLSSNQLVDLMMIIIESGHEWILNRFL